MSTETDTERGVLLITMPFGPMTRPAAGISLLKAELAREGVPCDLRYLNLFFAELVGVDTYRELSEELPNSSLFGDWLFREQLFGPSPERDREYLQDYLPAQYRGAIDRDKLDFYVECRALVGPYLDACLERIPWEGYRLVGFTTTFEQTIASLALARRIRARHPELAIAFGGANCEGEMGRELHRQFPFIDYVFSGESDLTLPELAKWLRGEGRGPAPRLEPRTVADLDALPYPDYSDFVAAFREHGLEGKAPVQLLIETSRGCWWGQKHQCTFCGLNGEGMRYRSKSPERVLGELRHLVERYDAKVVWGTDNNLDTRYFRTLLPALKEHGPKLKLFFETKANLKKEQLKLMKDAGLDWFQPGIESLSTHQLALMNKGCTALQNVQILKWARQFRMLLTWNVLMGFPGETAEDYARMGRLCDALVHLQPPSGAHPIRLDRFSPYFNEPEKYGLARLQPYPSYAFVYPFPPESLRRLAYFFQFEYRDGYAPLEAGKPMLEAVARWSRPQSYSVLYAIPGEQLLLLVDTRPVAKDGELVLTGLERELYLFCDTIRSFEEICGRAREARDDVPEEEVRAFLRDMLERQLMWEEDGHFLALAVLVEEGSDLGELLDPRRLDRERAERAAANAPAL